MKIAILNDTHAGIRNASEIFLNNADKFYSELFFPYLLKNDIKHIVHLGDIFDQRKFVNFKVINKFRKCFLSKLREYKITMDVIPGNHDVFFKNTNDLNSLKELLGHYMNEVNIVMEPKVLEYGSLKMGLIPWMNQENTDTTMEFIRTCKADILGGHFEFNGFDMMRGIKNNHGMDHKLFKRFEAVYSGHFHTKSQIDNVMYLGTQMEFFWSDAHDRKHFHVLDSESRELTAIENPHTLYEKIIYDDKDRSYSDYPVDHLDEKFVKIVVINKQDLFTFDRFVDRIQNRNIHELKIAENFEEFVGNKVEGSSISVEDTSELLDSYIESVDTTLDKELLKGEMRALLTEAQSLEIA